MENVYVFEPWIQQELRGEMLIVAYSQQQAVIVDMLKPELSKDGDQWCVIKGHLPEPDCIVGFGKNPEQAYNNFYRAYQGLEPRY